METIKTEDGLFIFENCTINIYEMGNKTRDEVDVELYDDEEDEELYDDEEDEEEAVTNPYKFHELVRLLNSHLNSGRVSQEQFEEAVNHAIDVLKGVSNGE